MPWSTDSLVSGPSLHQSGDAMQDEETTTVEFLKPRLCGGRFEQGGIPLDTLKDLAVLQEMLIEVAKWRFLEENPDRVRSPRGFTEGVELRLSGIEEGSVRPVLELSFSSSQPAMLPTPRQGYFQQALDSIIGAIGAVEHNEPVLSHLPEGSLAYFNRIGRSLGDNEYIEFDAPSSTTPIRLTRRTRRQLILASSSVKEITEGVSLRGSIPEADQDAMTFELQLIQGQKVPGPIPDQHYETILSAFSGYRRNTRVLLQGVGRYNRQNRLVGVESVEHVALLDPLDVPARLDEFRGMRDGWLEGGGQAPDHDGLDWLADSFEQQFPSDLPLPYLFPTEDGGVQAEWEIGSNSISLDVNLINHHAEWHRINLQTNEDDFQELDLARPESWIWFGREIHTMREAQA